MKTLRMLSAIALVAGGLSLAPMAASPTYAQAEKCVETQKEPGSQGTFTTCPDQGNPHNEQIVKGNEQTLEGNNPHNDCVGFNQGQEKKC